MCTLFVQKTLSCLFVFHFELFCIEAASHSTDVLSPSFFFLVVAGFALEEFCIFSCSNTKNSK